MSVYLAHWLWVCGACGEVSVQVQSTIQAPPAIVPSSSVGQAGRHQGDTLMTNDDKIGREGRGHREGDGSEGVSHWGVDGRASRVRCEAKHHSAGHACDCRTCSHVC